jgi:hypothetical protein
MGFLFFFFLFLAELSSNGLNFLSFFFVFAAVFGRIVARSWALGYYFFSFGLSERYLNLRYLHRCIGLRLIEDGMEWDTYEEFLFSRGE